MDIESLLRNTPCGESIFRFKQVRRWHCADEQEGLSPTQGHFICSPFKPFELTKELDSGKSSLILLLLRLLDPVEKDGYGYTLSIDGVPLSSINRQTLRERLITVPQDPVFLPTGSTVKENLNPLGLATTEQCREVLEAMAIWDVVEAQGGLDSVLSESSLSHGQRQVFSLARAVVKRKTTGCAVLLLDEFTSSVDADTEGDMLAIIDKEFASCTIIMVAHRLHLVSDFCDRVFVLDGGRVVEAGDPRVLGRVDETWFASLLAASK